MKEATIEEITAAGIPQNAAKLLLEKIHEDPTEGNNAKNP